MSSKPLYSESFVDKIKSLTDGKSFKFRFNDSKAVIERVDGRLYVYPKTPDSKLTLNGEEVVERRVFDFDDVLGVGGQTFVLRSDARKKKRASRKPSVSEERALSPRPTPDFSPIQSFQPSTSKPEPQSVSPALAMVDGSQTVSVKWTRKTILDKVTVCANKGEFIGVVGGSGSGKSTFLKAIAGINELTSGQILLDGLPVSRGALLGDSRIAYLPQDVVIHESLPARTALNYIAKLKNIRGRREAIESVLERVGMTEFANTPIKRLSGGQQKRVALAAELLGDPDIILLDEATSGLDPKTEAEMMELFKSLADEGKTVFCITHFPKHLNLCDRLLCMMRGALIFSGSPRECLEFFQVSSIEEIYDKQTTKVPEEWRRLYEKRYRVSRPIFHYAPPEPRQTNRSERFERFAQLGVLLSRYARLQLTDVKNCLLLFLQAPAIALMIGFSFGKIASEESGMELINEAQAIKGVVFSMILSILWCSGTSSVREIVKESSILTHEVRFGVRTGVYLVSKIILLSFFIFLQSFLLLYIVRKMVDLPGSVRPQFLILFFTGISGIAVGLLTSATSKNVERAMTLLPIILIGQAIFSGGIVKLKDLTQKFAECLVPAYWALQGLFGTFSQKLQEAKIDDAIMGSGRSGTIVLLVLTIMSAVLFGLTARVLRKKACFDFKNR